MWESYMWYLLGNVGYFHSPPNDNFIRLFNRNVYLMQNLFIHICPKNIDMTNMPFFWVIYLFCFNPNPSRNSKNTSDTVAILLYFVCVDGWFFCNIYLCVCAFRVFYIENIFSLLERNIVFQFNFNYTTVCRTNRAIRAKCDRIRYSHTNTQLEKLELFAVAKVYSDGNGTIRMYQFFIDIAFFCWCHMCVRWGESQCCHQRINIERDDIVYKQKGNWQGAWAFTEWKSLLTGGMLRVARRLGNIIQSKSISTSYFKTLFEVC